MSHLKYESAPKESSKTAQYIRLVHLDKPISEQS